MKSVRCAAQIRGAETGHDRGQMRDRFITVWRRVLGDSDVVKISKALAAFFDASMCMGKLYRS